MTVTADALFTDAPAPANVAALSAPLLTEMLYRHHQPEGRPAAGLFATEIQSPDGSRRADALWMPFRRADGYTLSGFEIKVSRADLLVELADPGKTEPWMQYCTYWWLVVSRPDMVAGLDIPVEWGILSPPSGRRRRTMTVLRPAPRLKPINPAPGLGRLVAWQAEHDDVAAAQMRRDLKSAREDAEYFKNRTHRLQAAAGTADVGGLTTREAALVGRLVARLSRSFAANHIWGSLTDHEDTIAAAILNWASTMDAATALAGQINTVTQQLQACMNPLSSVERTLDRMRRLASAATKARPPADELEATARFLLADQLGAEPIDG